jgi:hypothetical protein
LLAAHKTGLKIEQFYFLAAGWLDRSLAASTSEDGRARTEAWWGGATDILGDLSALRRAQLMSTRFVEELGYASAEPYAVHKRKGGGRVMYYMIHATDHPEARKLMDRAYKRAAMPAGMLDELPLDFG